MLDEGTGDGWLRDANVRCDVREDARTLARTLRRPISVVAGGVVLETHEPPKTWGEMLGLPQRQLDPVEVDHDEPGITRDRVLALPRRGGS